MNYFIFDDKLDNYDFSTELKFTRIYQEMKHCHPAAREAECLKFILPKMMLPIEEKDLLVGRKRYLPVGIAPGYWNDDWDGQDHLGYYGDAARLQRLFDRSNLAEEDKSEVEKMISFWRTEDGNVKIRARFTELMKREMPTDYWDKESGVIFPLYRLASGQLNYDKLVQVGLPGLLQEINEASQRASLTNEQIICLNAMSDTICVLIDLLKQYEALIEAEINQCRGEKRKSELCMMLQSVRNLQTKAPTSFHEALQLVWLYAAFSGTIDFNRMDVYFGDLYVHDVDNGVITEEEAVSYLLSYYQLSREVFGRDTRIIMGGKGRRNTKNADRFSLLAMKVCAIHGEIQPQLSLRMYKGMDQNVWEAAADLLQKKMTYPLLFNDEASISAVQKSMHVSEEVAEQYTFFGCGEYVINHKSMGTPNAIINLLKVLEITLHNGYDRIGQFETGLKTGEFTSYQSFDELLEAYKKQVEYYTELAADQQRLSYAVTNENAAMLMMSILYDDCIGRGKAALDGGIEYLAGTYETYGNISTSDSLLAIKKTVFEDKIFTKEQLLTMLDNDFRGFEEEQKLLRDLPKYGNEDEEADHMAFMINDHVCRVTASQAQRVGLASYSVVIINNSANTVLGMNTEASADGRNAFTYMSNGNAPTAGNDKSGLTAMLNSVSKTDVSITAGAAQNIKLSEELFTKHRDKLNALIWTIFNKGLLSLSISVLSRTDLEQALIYPERYNNLFVRVGGFSQRFILLSPEVQRDIINRTLY